MTVDANRSTLIGLPIELRELIYREILVDGFFPPRQPTYRSQPRGPSILALSHVCQTIRREVWPLLMRLPRYRVPRSKPNADIKADPVSEHCYAGSLRNVVRVCGGLQGLEWLGFDLKTMQWSIDRNMLPAVREVSIGVQIAACPCDHVPLVKSLDCAASLRDGEYLRHLLDSRPEELHLAVSFSIAFAEYCTAFCDIDFELDALRRVTLGHLTKYYSTTQAAVEFLVDMAQPEDARDLAIAIHQTSNVVDDESNGEDPMDVYVDCMNDFRPDLKSIIESEVPTT